MEKAIVINKQYVCTACGFNMIGFYPKRCRFCGATPDHFLTVEECSAKFKVESTAVNSKITRLNSVPQLGLEHAAYRVETGEKSVWIDCPSSFDRNLQPVDLIMFTHNDFLGASNLYRQRFDAQVWLHKLDATHPNSRFFTFDNTFETNFQISGIEAIHVGGHSPGFTIYFFEDVLFIGDYVLPVDNGLIWNLFGNKIKTPEVGKQIHRLLQSREINTVCGFNYVCEYQPWKEKLDRLVERSTDNSYNLKLAVMKAQNGDSDQLCVKLSQENVI
jgi:hypothetical protein